MDFADDLESDIAGKLVIPGVTSIYLIYPNGTYTTYTWKQVDDLIKQLFDDSLRYYIVDVDKRRYDNYWNPKFTSDNIEAYIFTLSENKSAKTNITPEFIDAVYRTLAWEEKEGDKK
jgi:hypothetical protein